ncbi:MAG: CtsR family transcriptional regulator [Ruminococcaceae bacterium]|nr:CtsR family transcriptional regulator [Oscillospiraceae bacterium]
MLTDTIAKLIEEMISEAGGSLELQRNDMAARLGCVPSQISYVITSRFTPERGYVIESRRGGGGCIRIVKKQMQRDEYLMHFFYAIGDAIDERSAEAYLSNLLENGLINLREKNMITAALSGSALSDVLPEFRNNIRAQIFRHIILSIMS